MAPHVIVSYDDSAKDRDALELGRQLAELGAELTLAYVRHCAQSQPDREQLAEHEAETLLAHGAALLDDPSVRRRVVISPSTGEGLARLAAELRADAIVFGSDYRTPTGHVAVGRTAQTLLDNGPVALGLAPAGYRAHDLERIALLPGTADEASIETAYAIAGRHDAAVTDAPHGADLIVAGSRREAPEGHVMVTSSAANAIDDATAPVLVCARGVALGFETLITA